MEPDVIEADGITKRFANRDVVERLPFTVRRGEVFAPLGPNGAGKTTCVRMLAGLIRPDAGRIAVSIDGRVTAALPPAHSAYLPEDRGLYREIPVLRTLVYFGRLRGLERREAERRPSAGSKRMGLADRGHDRIDALSKGNQQRVQLIAAIMHRPALAILDEPFTGLDPVSQEFFLELVSELKAAGTTILLSAHQMALVERTADRVLLMNRGREILSGSIAELRARLDSRPRVRLAFLPGGNPDSLRTDPDVEEITLQGDSVEVMLRAGSDAPRFFARAGGCAISPAKRPDCTTSSSARCAKTMPVRIGVRHEPHATGAADRRLGIPAPLQMARPGPRTARLSAGRRWSVRRRTHGDRRRTRHDGRRRRPRQCTATPAMPISGRCSRDATAFSLTSGRSARRRCRSAGSDLKVLALMNRARISPLRRA